MNQTLIDSLNYQKHIELEPYFNSSLFNSIIISENKKISMMDSGYLSNLTTRFWRLLQINKFLSSRITDIEFCNFLLEIFLNQALSCTDILATCLNHFIKMGLSGQKLSIHEVKFLEKLKIKINGFPAISKIESYHYWVKEKLYPYRNIVHHMGEPSGYVQFNEQTLKIECCLTLKEDEWDFEKLRKNLKAYPSHTAFLIDTNTINIPNINTGSKGDAHKYIRIDSFFESWTKKVFELIQVYINGMLWYQSNISQ